MIEIPRKHILHPPSSSWQLLWILFNIPPMANLKQYVLMEHSQDVKCVSGHPTELVQLCSLTPHIFFSLQILASALYDNTIKLYVEDPFRNAQSSRAVQES